MVYQILRDRITDRFERDNAMNGLNNDQQVIMRCL